MASIAARLDASVGNWAVGVVTIITSRVVLDTWLNVDVTVFSIRGLRWGGGRERKVSAEGLFIVLVPED